jgi:ketosteroid isomerase-like protein
LLAAFANAVQTNDGQALARLFMPDGVYEDGFFGSHAGRAAITTMLQRFHDTGSSYLWEFVDPVSDGDVGYAHFRFSYTSRLPESIGRPVLFEGISCFRFRGDLIAHYSEIFDRGAALFSSRAHQAHPAEGRSGAKSIAGSPPAPRPIFVPLASISLFQHLGDLGGLSRVADAVLDMVARAVADAVGCRRIGTVIEQKAHHLR